MFKKRFTLVKRQKVLFKQDCQKNIFTADYSKSTN